MHKTAAARLNPLVIAAAMAATAGAFYANTNWLESAGDNTGGPRVSAARERCYGVVRAGKNDCATSKHSCAAQARQDGDREEWVMLPKGLCEKFAGGSVTETAGARGGE